MYSSSQASIGLRLDTADLVDIVLHQLGVVELEVSVHGTLPKKLVVVVVQEGQYSGKYCEDCPTCPGKCEELKACVQCQVFRSGELMGEQDEYGVDKCSLCPFKPEIVEKAEDLVQNDERLCTFIDDDDCRFTFVYGYKNETGELQVWVQETKECPVVVDIMGIVLGVIGAIVAIGLALILMWKVFTSIHDRREFAKFEKERMLAKW